jgi:CubicO group peptidase (beta-lactamase class C family)
MTGWPETLSNIYRKIMRKQNLTLTSVSLLLLLALVSCSTGTRPDSSSLPRSVPEAEGVSSRGILEFLDAASRSSTEFHSFIFLRSGRVIAEGWWDPYRPELRHTLYSTSKSFTSTAIGLAASEGLLTVDDRVISFFPEELPDTISPFLAELEVKDLLCMAAGLDPDPTRIITSSGSDWVKAFLSLPVVNEPGSRFLYNSMATYMLSAIVQKVTGEKVIDYLTPRLFEPLGIEGMDWEVDPKGINTGGWGLRLRTADMAKFGQLYLQKGNWNGVQLLPAAWVEEATTAHIDQTPGAPQSMKDSSDWMQGYCYQFWRCRNNGFRADGAFGQFIVVLPEKRAVIAVTAESPDMQAELNLVWEHLIPAMHEEALPEDAETAAELEKRLSSLALPLPASDVESPVEEEISGKTFTYDPNEAHVESADVLFEGGTCRITLKQNGNTYPLSFGKGAWIEQETAMPGPNLLNNAIAHFEVLPTSLAAGSYGWKDEKTLELVLRYIESPHHEVITCVFEGDQVTVDVTTSYAPQFKPAPITGRIR